MQLVDSLQRPQEPATDPYPVLVESTPHPHNLFT
jgi:hypothetical protein